MPYLLSQRGGDNSGEPGQREIASRYQRAIPADRRPPIRQHKHSPNGGDTSSVTQPPRDCVTRQN